MNVYKIGTKNGIITVTTDKGQKAAIRESGIKENELLSVEKVGGERQSFILPVGIEDWQEVHFEVVAFLVENRDNEETMAYSISEDEGIGGLYEKAMELTYLFVETNKDVNWGLDKDWYDTLEEFFEEQTKLYFEE